MNEKQAQVIEDGMKAASGIGKIASGNIIGGAAEIVGSILPYILNVKEELSAVFEAMQ